MSPSSPVTFPFQSALLALGILGWLSATSSADPIPIKIELDAPAGCSDADAFYERIHARTDRVRPAGEGDQALHLRVRLVRSAGKVRGELRIADEQGTTDTRKVDGASCDEVVDALSLTAALALDPSARLSLPAPASSGSTPAPASSNAPPSPSGSAAAGAASAAPPNAGAPAPAPSPSASGSAVPNPPRSISFGAEIGAQGIATTVLRPRIDFGGAFFARLDVLTGETFSPSLGLSLLYAADDVLQPGADVSARLWGIALSACPFLWRMGELSLQPCALGIAGELHAEDRVIPAPEGVDRSWWSAGGLARFSWRPGGQLALQLEAGLTVPLAERRFVTLPANQEVATTPTISPFGSFGAALYF